MDPITMIVGQVTLFVGSLGVIEMLATANEKWTKQGRLSREIRFELYFAASLAATMFVLRSVLFGPL